MKIDADERVFVKILTAGDENSLEDKINMYLADNPDKSLANIQMQQVEYHARTGSVDFGLLVIMVLRAKL